MPNCAGSWDALASATGITTTVKGDVTQICSLNKGDTYAGVLAILEADAAKNPKKKKGKKKACQTKILKLSQDLGMEPRIIGLKEVQEACKSKSNVLSEAAMNLIQTYMQSVLK